MMTTGVEFHPADYVVFAASLAVCAGIGAYYGLCKKSKDDESTSPKKAMGLFPASFSVMASFLAAPFVLGTPAEIYLFGTMYFLTVIGFGMCMPVVSFVLIPKFFQLNLKSGYQYFELRWNRAIRNMANLVFGLMIIFYMGIVVYAPALAFSQVTGLPMLATILGVGAVCIFYTALGGLQAVMWIDVIQMLIILLGILLLAIKGSIDVGGVGEVWKIADEGGRIVFDEISPDPRARHTWWTMTIGASLTSLVLIGINQATIQKYLSVKDLSTAKKIPLVTWVLLLIYMLLVCYCGLVMYAYYHNCDPLVNGDVEAADQMIPFFVLQCLGEWYGIPGLFTAAVFSATLSTVAAGINALSFLTCFDAVVPIYAHIKKQPMSPRGIAWTTKILAVIFGGATIGLAYLAPLLGDILMQISLSIFGMAGGPLLGLFCLGLFFPRANAIGAAAGTMTGLFMGFWVGIAAVVTETNKTYQSLQQCVTECPGDEVMHNTTQGPGICITRPAIPYKGGINQLYDISYIWYTLLSVLTTVIVGMAVSLITDYAFSRSSRFDWKVEQVPRKYLFTWSGVCASQVEDENGKDVSDANEAVPDSTSVNLEKTFSNSAITPDVVSNKVYSNNQVAPETPTDHHPEANGNIYHINPGYE